MPAYGALLIEVDEDQRGAAGLKPTFDAHQFSLLVEDERLAREGLARILQTKGLKVHQAQNAREAIDFANTMGAGVVLMDIDLGEDIDGIDAAAEIQRENPHSSVIFVTAHAGNTDYLKRTKEFGLRVAGWIDKPILWQLSQLFSLIEKEAKKVEVRRLLEKAKERCLPTDDFVRSIALWDATISEEIVAELLEELRLRENEPGVPDAEAEITRLYGEIRSLMVRSATDPGLKSEIAPLMERLRKLQEQEADEMERRFRARLPVQPETVQDLLAQARRLAGE